MAAGAHNNSSFAPTQNSPSSLAPANASFMQQHGMSSLSPGGGSSGPGTPTRQGGLMAPSVVISPSAPVSLSFYFTIFCSSPCFLP